MADWGTNGNANRIKDTYIKGFLDISGGSVIVEKTSTLKIMSHDSDHPILEFKPEYFTVNTTSAFDVSYSSLATLGLLGISFEQSTVETAGRIKYITTGTIGAPPNEVFYTEIGNDDEKSQLQVYGLIKGHYGLDIDGDVSFNNNLFVKNDLSLNGNISIGRDLSLNGNMYVSKRSVFTLDVSMNSNLDIGNGSSCLAVNKDISAGYALDVSGLTMLRNRLNVISDVSLNRNTQLGLGTNSVAINKDISNGIALDVSGATIFRGGMDLFGAFTVNGQPVNGSGIIVNLTVTNDSSLNGKLSVGGDVSMNGNIRLGNSVAINKDISAGYALDVSGLTLLRNTLNVIRDVSLNANFFVGIDSSLNGNVSVGRDLSLNGNLYVSRRALILGDVSMNGNTRLGNSVAINKDISAGYALDVSGFTILRNTMYVSGDVSLNSNFFVTIDSSLNGNVSVGRDLSLNGNLYVSRRALILGDVSMNGNTRLGTGSNSVAINKDVTAGYALDVSGLTILRNTLNVIRDVSLNANFYVGIDSSLNGNVSVGRDLSLNGNLYVSRRSVFTLDVSMNGNLDIGSGTSCLAVNKDISAGYALDVSGLTILRNTLNVSGNVSLNANFFVGIDSSLNGNVSVGRDLSLNGNLYVSRRALILGDVSMNGNTRLGNSVAINKDISAGYALDVSGLTILRNTLNVIRDVSLNSNFYVSIDSSLNGNVSVGRDLSLNGNLYVSRRALFLGDVSLNGNTRLGTGSNSVAINKDVTAGYALDVSGLTILRNTVFVSGDVSLNANFFVGIDSSLNGNVSVGRDLSLNGNLYVSRRALFLGDVSLNANLFVAIDSSLNGNVSVGRDLSLNGNLYVSRRALFLGDVSLNANLFVAIDSSLNGNVSVGRDLSLNGNLYVSRRALILGDVSMNGNTRLGTGFNSVAINKDISGVFALDVSGTTKIRGSLDVSGVFTVNGAPVSGGGGASLTGNVQVGSNSGFVTVDKPQFFSDPSLTIFYDFDTSYNTTRIQNMASITGLYDGSMNGVTTGLIIIDPNNPKYGTASLRNTPSSGGKGISIGAINTSIPVSSTMSFSLWVRKPNKPVSPDWDRIFEFSDYTAISSVPGQHNNTIALDISADGFVYPKITYSGPSNNSCFATLSSPNIFYNLGNGLWNHILWIINSNKSFIYINGSLTQSDNITNFPATSTRASGFIAYSYVLGDVNYGNDFSGNIDDFRYYNGKALNYAEIYQLYNNTFYTLDICGGFLTNGSSVIYEPVGSMAGPNSGSLTLLHGDASGSSSIMFKSVNDPLDYAYIEYDENVTGSTGLNYGLMTIGIENDAGSTTTQADRLSLFPSGGTGFVGVNTKTPVSALDVSGQMRVYEGAGTSAAVTGGSLTLEHANTGGTSSLVFKASNSSTTNDYAYVQYQDATNIVQSLIKYDLSVNNPSPLTASATVSSTGTATYSMTFAPSDNSFAWFQNPTSIGGVTPAYCISFNQTNLSSTDTTSRINYTRITGLEGFSSFSFSAWIRPGTITPADGSTIPIRWMIANLTNSSVEGVIDIWLENNGAVYALLGDDQTNYIRTSATTVVINNWYHIVFTFDGNNRNGGKLYINGTQDTLIAGTGLTDKSLKINNTLDIGIKYGWYTGTGSSTTYTSANYIKGFRGQMAFVNVFDVPLTATDVAYLYNNPGYSPSISDCGLMTIGIESDTGYINNDRIALLPGGGQGFVGINTKNPLYILDVSGTLNTNADATMNGVSVGRGSGNVATNTVVGYQTLKNNTTGIQNVALGYIALTNNVSGSSNTAIGNETGTNITTQSNNTAIGVYAGSNPAGVGSQNTFLGAYTSSAGNHSTSTAVGYNAQITASNQIRLGTDAETVRCGKIYSYESTGTLAAATGGSLTLEHGDASGCSSIVFKSKNDNTDYAYIQYQENFNTASFTGANPAENGLLTIGIENDPGTGSTSDRICLWSGGGTGYVGINTKNPVYTLDVNGNVNATSYNATSDYRIKKNVVPLDLTFNVDVLKPVSYVLKDDKEAKLQIGFIAHEVQEFYPFLVNGEKDGQQTQSINYNGFIGILTNEIQVLKKKVAEQEAQSAKALAKAAEQETRISEQETRISEQSAKALAEALAEALAKAAEQDQRISALEKMMLDLVNK